MEKKFSLFGFTIARDKQEDDQAVQQSFTPPGNEDGALTITSAAYYGTYVDLDGTAKNDVELISRYREMAMQPEIESAIDDIVNEAITHDVTGRTVDIITDKLKQPETVKKKIHEEFQNILKMLNFGNLSDDLFKRWYIDGRIYYHVVVDEKDPKAGIQELRYIDPRKIRKVREIQKDRDSKTGAQIIPADATNEEDLANLVAQATEILGGKLDFVLHSIGMSVNVRKGKAYTDENYDFTAKGWDVSALSFHKVMKSLYHADAMNEWGSIIALTYMAAQRTFPDYNDMADAKSLLESITRSFGYHYGVSKKVRVNTISQSPTVTTAGSGVSGFDKFISYSENMSPLSHYIRLTVLKFATFT